MNNRANAMVGFEPESLGLAPGAPQPGWLLLRTAILTPLVLAIAAIVLLAIGVHFAWRQLARRRTCTAH